MVLFIGVGILVGVLGQMPQYIQRFLMLRNLEVEWTHATWVLAVTAFAFVAQRFILDRQMGNRRYDGAADLFLHVHVPAQHDPPLRWVLRGFISFLLALFGGRAGPEGAAIEWAHAFLIRFRKKSARWFEQRRRTDASAALGAGVAAVLGAPVAAIFMGMEMGLGGRTLSVAIAAFAAFATREFIVDGLGLAEFQTGAEVLIWTKTVPLWLLAVTLACGIFASLWIRFYRYSQDSLVDLFHSQIWMRVLTAGTLLFLLSIVAPQWSQPSWRILQQALWMQYSSEQILVGVLVQSLGLALLLSGFGTLGMIWSLLALGGLIGAFLQSLGAPAGIVLVGAGAFFGVVIGAPISAAVMIYELSALPFVPRVSLAAMTLVAAWGAVRIRKWTHAPTLADADLVPRGLQLREGRMQNVLESLFVRDAMVTDFEAVHEQEPLSDLSARLIKSRYPFFPVVNGAGQFTGFLTAELVQSSWNRSETLAQKSPLSRLMEVKDLLYRSGFKAPVVKVTDRLDQTVGIFDDLPCVPVVAEDGRVQGLLFAHNVRLVYEREIARRSLAWERPKSAS